MTWGCPDFRAAKVGLSPSGMGKLFFYESLAVPFAPTGPPLRGA